MTRAEALRIGKAIADRKYEIEKPYILAKQYIERMKRKKESTPVPASVDKM
ncbi:hypothetical protein IGI78_000790 [Enterococcus sp. DIV1767]|uniref:hypothetical protein n=1 Tax=Enterococcus sp. DIV1767 TaxID=2774670 RepID=UPI003D300F50